MDEPELDPLIHQPTRFRILLLLFRYRQASATSIKGTLQLTDGNLWGHAQKLVDTGYIQQGRTLTRDGFQVVLRITPVGTEAFQRYLASWEDFLRRQTDADPVRPPS